MRLHDNNGNAFEITLQGYECPKCLDSWDANWLKVRVHAAQAGREWFSTDPCLTTWEVESLITWIESVYATNPSTEKEEFTEPNLGFQLIDVDGELRTIRVYFELESRPPWAPSMAAYENDYWLDIRVTREDLQNAATGLRRQLVRYPSRRLSTIKRRT